MAAAFQQGLEDAGAFADEILEQAQVDEEQRLLQVVEVHQGWCGPCKAIVGTFQRISIDMSDSPLKFYRANCDKVEQLGKYVGQCQPVFLFYKGGVVVEEVVGVDTPMLTSKIKSLV